MASEVSIAGADLPRRVAELEQELNLAHQREAATAEVLKVISASGLDVQRALDTLVESAAHLCDAYDASILQVVGDGLRLVAHHGQIPTPGAVGQATIPLARGLIAARAVIDRRTIQVADMVAEADEYPESRQHALQLGYRTALGVPLIRAGEAIGVIFVRRTEVRPFTERQIELVNTFADQAIIAIENTRLFEEVQARNSELRAALEQQTATSEVLSAISRSPTELQPVLDSIVETAARLCQADHAHVFRLRDGKYHLAAHNQTDPGIAEYLTNNPIGLDQLGSVTARAARSCKTVHVPDATQDPEYGHGPLTFSNDRTVLSVPLLRNAAAQGVVTVGRRATRPFNSKEIELIETFADQAVIAIENTRLFEAEQASKRDLQRSLDYQTATSEVLNVISRSPSQLQPVVDAIVQTAKRLCSAERATMWRWREGRFDLLAHTIIDPALANYLKHNPIPPDRTSLATRAVLEGQTMHVPDLQTEPELGRKDQVVVGRIRTLLAVPLLRKGEPIGVLSLSRSEVEPFSDSEIELVQTFADQGVIAIENTRLFEAEQASKRELQESLEYQTATSDVLSVISRSPTNIQPVFDTIAQAAAQLCKAQFCHVFRFDGQLIHFAASHGQPQASIDNMRRIYPIPPSRVSATARSIHTGTIEEITDIHADPEYQHGDTANYRSIVAVPMLKDSRPVGTICMARTETGAFPKLQVELLRTFADQAVIAIENTRLFQEVQTRTGELQDALDYQTATSEILGIISRSPTDVQPVFDVIARNAVRLCAATYAMVFRFDGSLMHLSAHHNVSPEGLKALLQQWPMPLDHRSVPARAVLERRIIHVHDVLTEANNPYLTTSRALGIRTMLIVPMLREGEPIGAVAVYRQIVEPFSDQQVALVATFASQAVIAVENVRLFNELDSRNRDLTALGDVGRAVSSTLDLKVVLKTIVDRAVELSGTDGGSIFYFREDIGRFQLGETTGLAEEVVARVRELDITAGQTGLGEAIAKREPLQMPDIVERPSNPLRDAAIAAGFRAALIVPLLSGDGPLGALVLQRRRPGKFPPEVVSLMQNFADQSAIALENARLFEEIAHKSRELEIASQHKSQFVANMSHELRTPLAAILGYAELMQEGFYEPLGQKSLDALTRIRSNGKHLLGLVNTVLDIAKIESGQFTLNMAEYAIESVVETVRSATESLAQNKKLTLKTEVAKSLPIGLGDEQRLTQVLLNLVGNAIKFTDTGEVRVTAEAVNGRFNVSVADTGPGIPEEHQARIFEQFHQVDSSNTKAKGGTGLGLAIAKQIVEMHGGRIWVESALGKGSTFQMEIPTSPASR